MVHFEQLVGEVQCFDMRLVDFVELEDTEAGLLSLLS